MDARKREIEQRMRRFEQACQNARIKITHQRIEIFREIAQTGEHPDAETIFRGVRKRVPTISLDTVYRTLWLLCDLGLIVTLGPSRERARFDANLTRHHHFVCVECGLTRDFHSDEFDLLGLPDSVKAFGRVDATHVEARGLCRRCAGKKADTTPTPDKQQERHS